MAGTTLPDRVAQIYYTYGLFCSSYPFLAVSIALSFVLICCYPLLNVPLPGNIPTVVKLPVQESPGLDATRKTLDCTSNCQEYDPFQLDFLHNETQKLPYIWSKDKPLLYVQQIILKTGVSPWASNLKMWDAFRAPLQEVFRILETIRNHEDPETKSTLASHCYQVDGLKRRDSKAEHLLPEYSCLLLSPANLWRQNLQVFSLDTNLISTIYNHQNLQKAKVSLAEMCFGLQLRDAGVKRYPLRARPRAIQYAVTIFYKHLDEGYIKSLTKKLKKMYPLYQETVTAHADDITLIYYPGEFNYHEFIPLSITFIGIFLYVYFSVRKIEFIKSKLGLAACAVVTVAGSLSMSIGICFYFGFSLSLQGKEIFPYLVIIVGLENVLVLTKSVTSTDSRLDVKIRLAQGLSKEGWSITKNLLTEITILTVSFFTFVPFIQEFSIFMIVSLISDYFVQMTFFATVLGIDVRRMEYYQEQSHKLHLKEYFDSSSSLNWRYNKSHSEESSPLTKSKSHPRLNGLAQSSPTDVVANRNSSPKHSDNRVPKRIRLVNFWARTRFFQRAFMLWMLVWISMIVYNSGVVDYFVSSPERSDVVDSVKTTEPSTQSQNVYSFYKSTESSMFSPLLEVDDKMATGANETLFLKHSANHRPWSRLSPYHWSSILSQYNASVGGRFVALLPATLLSWRVGPELAASVRNPDERDPPPLRWQALAAALDPIDILPEFDTSESLPAQQWGKATDLPIYPTTPMEILLLAILCCISVAVIAYMMVVLYRCVCSRHYAEWRASWTENDEYLKTISNQPAVQLVLEAVPLVVSGHQLEVECLVTDGDRVLSVCLHGTIKLWDQQNREVITHIDRYQYFKLQKELYDKVNSKKEVEPKSPEVSVPPDVTEPKNSEWSHKLRRGLGSHLSGLRFRAGAPESPLAQIDSTKYSFAKTYRDLYCSGQTDHTNYNGLESKENIDITNQLTTEAPDAKNSDIFTFNSAEKSSLRNRTKPKLVLSESEVKSETVSDSDKGALGWRSRDVSESPIWCVDYCNDLIILGCADGRLEFWEATSGKLMGIWWWSSVVGVSRGVTHVRLLCGGRRAVAAALSGHLMLLRIDAYNQSAGVQVDWRFSTAHRRTHKRTGSAGCIRSGRRDAPGRASFAYESDPSDGEEVHCVRLAHCRPHQQPISELHCEGGRILTGGQDHVLKVFTSDELGPLFTLHGHCGPITSCFIDHATPTIGGSGSQDGLLCVWDLHTGACLYSSQAHAGAVTSLAYTASYVVSAGSDERLCVWDRFQGHLLTTVHIGLNYMSKMLPLTHTLLLMGDRSGLVVYDLSSGDVIRRVLLGQNDGCIYVRQILPLKDAIVCDYANQLRIVRFPLVSKLSDMKNE